MIMAGLTLAVVFFLRVDRETITVTGKSREDRASGAVQYVVRAREGRYVAYGTTDTGGLNPSRLLYNKVRVGETYDCDVRGFSVPVISVGSKYLLTCSKKD